MRLKITEMRTISRGDYRGWLLTRIADEYDDWKYESKSFGDGGVLGRAVAQYLEYKGLNHLDYAFEMCANELCIKKKGEE